jgi:hypothetical protein
MHTCKKSSKQSYLIDSTVCADIASLSERDARLSVMFCIMVSCQSVSIRDDLGELFVKFLTSLLCDDRIIAARVDRRRVLRSRLLRSLPVATDSFRIRGKKGP